MRLVAFLLSSLLALPALAAAPKLEMFQVRAHGTLTIDEQGQVAEVRLETKHLGEEVQASFEQMIRGWRFEPILEDGQPVRALGRMNLSLMAFRQPGVDGLRLGVHRVSFLDPPAPGQGPGRVAGRDVPPDYPDAAAREGIGAEVSVLVRVGEGGKVEDAAVTRLWLLGSQPTGKSRQPRHARAFKKSAEDVARRWRFEEASPGETLVVPIRYTAPFMASDRWTPFFPMDVDVPDWARQALGREDGVRTAELNGLSSGQIRLLTRLDPLPDVSAEG